MSDQTIEAMVRRIVRDELRQAGVSVGRAVDTGEADRAVGVFLGTVAEGERVGGRDLYLRWEAWRARSAACPPVSVVTFGLAVTRSPLMVKVKASRVTYTRVGAPRAPEAG